MNTTTNFYILFSSLLNRYYTGITTDPIEIRLLKHNISYHGAHFTSSANDWEVKLVIECETYSFARKMELYIKRMKSRKLIERIINDIDERKKLIDIIKSN